MALEFVVEQRALRQHGVAAFDAEAEIDHLVDLAAVDGDRQRAAEAHVAEEFAPARIAGVEIGIERHLRAPGRVPQPTL